MADNFENEVTLELSDGSKRTYEIITAPYNDDLGDIRLICFEKKINEKTGKKTENDKIIPHIYNPLMFLR